MNEHDWVEIKQNLKWCKHCGALGQRIEKYWDYKAPIFTMNSPNFEGWSENYPVCARLESNKKY